MPTITALTPFPRKADRYQVLVDGEPFVLEEGGRPAAVDVALIHDLKLKVGTPWTSDLALRLAEGAVRVQAFDRALGAIARRAHSVMELRRSLARKEVPRPVVDDVIDRLSALGLLDDAAYARTFAQSRLVGRGMGEYRVRAELSRRGVSRADADSAVAAVLADEEVDVVAQVRKLAERKARSLAKLELPVRRRRLMAFLLRKGFDGATIRRVVHEFA